MLAFKKSKTEGYYAVGFNENKALWRNSLSLFQTIDDEQMRPKMLDWLNDLSAAGFLERSSDIPVEFYGLAADNAKLFFWQKENFDLPLAYLQNNDFLNLLKTAIQFADDVAFKVLKDSLKNLAKSLKTDVANFSAMAVYWSSLETAFQHLLSNLPTKQEEAMRQWFGLVLTTAKSAFDQTANSLSSEAAEQKAIVQAENLFYGLRKKLLNTNSEFRKFLPNSNSTGGTQ